MRLLKHALGPLPTPYSAAFDVFWLAYPRRQAKLDAWKAWEALQPSEALQATILSALDWQRQQPAWLKDGGAFCPLPASWLRARRWDDEPFDAVSVARPRSLGPDYSKEAWYHECRRVHGEDANGGLFCHSAEWHFVKMREGQS